MNISSKKVLAHIKRTTLFITHDLIINTIASSKLVPREIRYLIYKAYGLAIKSWHIAPDCFFGGEKIEIGRNVFINHNCFFDLTALVEIGDNTGVGMQVMFCTGTHKIGPPESRFGEMEAKPIKIGCGCWIGARVTILPGVVIGDGCIIGAGSVVNKNCEANHLYAGVPAIKIRKL